MLPFVRRAILTGKLSHNDKIKRHDEYTDVFPPRALPLAFFFAHKYCHRRATCVSIFVYLPNKANILREKLTVF